MKYRPVFVAVMLTVALLLAVAQSACQPKQEKPTPVESSPVTEPMASETEGPSLTEYHVRENGEATTDLAPGLYCLWASDGKGQFQLVVPGQPEDQLVREDTFSSRVWVEVREGELLRFSGDKIESYDEREQQGFYPTRASNGFFLIGMDFFPGILTVQSLVSEGNPVCEIYATAHDLSEGPIRSYDFPYTLINIEVEEGEYLLLRDAEASMAPS